jgi:hypothetical protein
MQDTGNKEILLADGSRILLVQMLCATDSAPDKDVERNIFRVSKVGEVLWQVLVREKAYPRSPFTGISINDQGNVRAYSWEGVEYEIDIATGHEIASHFVK